MNDPDPGWAPPAPARPAPPPPPSYGAPPGPTPPPSYAADQPPPSKPPVGQPAKTLGWLMLAAAVVVAIAAFMPWITIFGLSISGIGGDDVGGAKDGIVTLTLAIPVAVLGLLRGLGKAMLGAAIVTVVCGALIALIAVVDIADVNDIGATVGVGLWLTLVGGLAMIGVGIGGIVRRR